MSEFLGDRDIQADRLSSDRRGDELRDTQRTPSPLEENPVSWNKYSWVGLTLFGLLSAADLLLTAALLRANAGAYEANPVAAACLEQHGWGGLAVYKVGAVLAFSGAVLLLVRRRPRVGAVIVTLGCLTLLSVTSYTQRLLVDAKHENIQLSLNERGFEQATGVSVWGAFNPN